MTSLFLYFNNQFLLLPMGPDHLMTSREEQSQWKSGVLDFLLASAHIACAFRGEKMIIFGHSKFT
jgi:hypothetical protein